MPLEQIFFREETIQPCEKLVDRNHWSETERGNNYMSTYAACFNKSCVFLAGMDIQDGRLLNGEDLIDIHELSHEFVTYKYIRTKFLKSDIY